LTEGVQLQRNITCPCGKPFRSFRAIGMHARHCELCTEEARFWLMVDKSAGPDGCWLFLGFIKWDGYGWVQRIGRHMTAHRYAWILANGEPQNGEHIMHSCDRPACCNPAHLSLGTHQDNMQDRTIKLRHVYGERGRRNKLSRDQVEAIRAEYHYDPRHKISNAGELAAKYGVGRGAITSIISGRNWAIRKPAPILHPERVRPRRQS
jgi:hypothetical protein